MNFSDFLDRDLALKKLWQHLPNARLVGGCVRDMIWGRDVHDFDLATPEPPEDVVKILVASGLKVVPTGLSHGTVTALVGDRAFEITTLRRDVTTDGRHAVVAWTDDWQQDAARRDFTINAMSCDRLGKIHDYFGGQADLAARHVRFVGIADDRIREDALRILRFFRFHAVYGDGAADKDAMQAIRTNSSCVEGLSGERITQEILRLINLPKAPETLALMAQVDILDRILPEAILDDLARLISAGAPENPFLRLAAVSRGSKTLSRLRLSRAEAGLVQSLRQLPEFRLKPDIPDETLRAARSLESAERLIMRSWLNQIEERGSESSEEWDGLRHRISALEPPEFPLTGRDMIAQGVAPGPELGRLLSITASWWRANGCIGDKAACLNHALMLQGLSHFGP